MEIYLDTVKIEEIRHASQMGLISGVTTSHSLMAQAGRADYRELVHDMCYLVQNSLSVAVTTTDVAGMVAEALEMASWSPHVVVKLGVSPAGLEAINGISELKPDTQKVCQGCPWFGKCDTDIELSLIHI